VAREPGAERGRLEEEPSKAPEPAAPELGALIIKSFRPGVPDEQLILKEEPEERNHIIEPGHEIAPVGEVGKVRANPRNTQIIFRTNISDLAVVAKTVSVVLIISQLFGR